MQLDQRGRRLSGILRSLRRRRIHEDEPLIQRGQADRVKLSVVPHAGVRHAFAVASTRPGSAVEDATTQALEVLSQAVDRAGVATETIRLTVFIVDPTMISPCLRAIRNFHGAALPVTDVIQQKPADGSPLAIEMWGLVADRDDISIERVGGQVVKVSHDGITAVHCSRVVCGSASRRVHEQATEGFASLKTLLAGQNAGFEQVIRTWLYLGDIVGPDGETQRYKELNRRLDPSSSRLARSIPTDRSRRRGRQLIRRAPELVPKGET